MIILPKNEDHLGGALCYPCKQWLVYSRQDVQVQKRKIYKVVDIFDPESEGYWEEIDSTVIVCPNCERTMSVTIIC